MTFFVPKTAMASTWSDDASKAIASALTKLVDEHGLPNTFRCAEVSLLTGMDYRRVGRAAHRYMHKINDRTRFVVVYVDQAFHCEER